MYISVNKHILSRAIMSVAIVKLIAALLEGVVRFFLEKNNSSSPDMLDIMLWHSQLIISLLQIAITAVIFFVTWKRLNHYVSVIPPEDRKSMGDLQKEYFGENIASLSVSSVNRLLQLWAVIFVAAELTYLFTSIMYRRFIGILMDALSNGEAMADGTFIMLYNMTHGFKYLEILSAILLGVVMTGIFLNDRYIKLGSLAILLLFLISFGAIQMQTVNLLGREIGIVWTSLIYHITETLGLALLSLYLSVRYKGL